ncbi:MAG: efflux RND transporter permease subunit [Kiritimatiellae bacterium]|nr:efflux RND transporter permease subunit [Kiritimatiellia bacterium]
MFLTAAFALAALGVHGFRTLPVDVFPDIAVPRVVLQTEARGLTAEEVEQRVTVPIETAMNGIPRASTIRSSSSGGLSFVWVDFEWGADLARARFDVFERLQRVRETLPPEVDVEIAPTVSVTGEIMLVALTADGGGVSPLELREMAEYVLRPRLLAVRGIGEVAVMGGRLPECRVSVSPRELLSSGLTVGDIVEAVRDTRTNEGAGYLPDVGGDEIPLRQVARADTVGSLARSPVVRGTVGALRLGDVAEVSVSGAPRRGSASFDGRDAVVLSVQKVPGGKTPELTREIDRVLESFGATVRDRGVSVHANAYRQADFIAASVKGGARVVRDAVIVVLVVLVLTLFRWRTILSVLASMALTMPIAVVAFPPLGLGVNVMTLGGFAVAAGDIVDAAIIFTEAIGRRRDLTIAGAVGTVLPGVAFSTLVVALVFVPLLLLSGLEGNFFRPLGLAYLAVFVTSLVVAFVVTPALAAFLRREAPAEPGANRDPVGVRVMKAVYRPFLATALRFPRLIVLAVVAATAAAVVVTRGFGSSFLPPFREDAFNVALSLPPGASLSESERVAEAGVAGLRSIPGVLSVTRRTGRAERDQHAEPVSSSEFVVRVDLDGDVENVRRRIRELLGGIPGCSVLVGYPIAHRISAVLSGTEAEVAVNVYGEDLAVLRETTGRIRRELETMPEVSDVRANREVTVRTLKIEYDVEALAEAGLTLREAGEQVSVAFNGIQVGEIREGLRRRAVVVRMKGADDGADAETVKSLLLSGRGGRRVRLDEVAQVVPEEASDLMLREGGRRKAMVSLNPAEGVDTGELVRKLHERLDPIVAAAGCSLALGGSSQARESAGRRLAVLSVVLIAAIFLVLTAALREFRLAALALVNVPLGMIGGVTAVALANPVLSVSSLVGFVTVVGFVLRNGILLL